MINRVKKTGYGVAAASIGIVLAAMTGQPAGATEGYFQPGYGAVSKSLAGAGVAYTQDAMGQALNPAGAVHVGNEVYVGASLFSPLRSFSAEGGSGPGILGNGSLDSDEILFLMPSFGLNYQYDEDWAIGLSLVGNGGMNTTWRQDIPCSMGAPGIFCGGDAGVDLAQVLLQATYSRKLNDNFSFGVAPIFAVQRFAAKGIAPFAMMSWDPANVTNNGYSMSYGFGGRVGIQGRMADNLSLGLSYQSRIYMSEFDEYSGLFAEQGDFDIPASFQVGLALQASEDVTLMFDYRRIFYSDVHSVGNKMTFPGPGTMLGDKFGPGFGWNDTDTVKIGVQYQANEKLTVRGGYSYTNQPIDSSEVLFNVLAPGVSEHHITAGATYDIDDRFSISFSGIFSPASTVEGLNPFDPGQSIEAEMYQFDAHVGLSYRF